MNENCDIRMKGEIPGSAQVRKYWPFVRAFILALGDTAKQQDRNIFFFCGLSQPSSRIGNLQVTKLTRSGKPQVLDVIESDESGVAMPATHPASGKCVVNSLPVPGVNLERPWRPELASSIHPYPLCFRQPVSFHESFKWHIRYRRENAV